LRGEILKRTEIQHQLISITLVAFGALISVGLRDSPTALLAYPLLALFLSAVWSYNDIRIRQLGTYIRDRIETELLGDGLGWEHALTSDSASHLVGSRTILATRGILWGTELLAVVLYLLGGLSFNLPQGDRVLLSLDILAIAFTVVLLRRQDVPREEIATSIQNAQSQSSSDAGMQET
jgi:hypothetical protein